MKRLKALLPRLYRRPALSLLSATLFASTSFSLPAVASAQNHVAATSVALAISANGSASNTVLAGSAVSLTASVTGGMSHGLVRFCDLAVAPTCSHENRTGWAQLVKGGSASIQVTPGPGVHSYVAVFYPQLLFASASSPTASLTVTTPGAPTSTTLTQAGKVGNYSLTATVSVSGKSTVLPRGTVSFLDTSANSRPVGTATLGAGTSLLKLISNTLPTPGIISGLSSVATADFNHDGKQDFVAIGTDSLQPSIFLGNGDGTFTVAPLGPANPNGAYQIKTADFNQDGNPDIALVNLFNNQVDILLGNGDGTFTKGQNIQVNASYGGGPIGIDIADFNGDGLLDLVLVNTYSGYVTFYQGAGDGTFAAPSWQAYIGSNPTIPISGDFNGDGIPDFAVVVSNYNSLQVFLGKGDGTFTQGQLIPTGNLPGFVVTGDFNGDGKVDLAVTNKSDGTVSIFLGNGNGTFTLKQTVMVADGTVDLKMADFNGDGVPDLAVTSSSTNTMSLLQGVGDGTFSTPLTAAAGSGPYQLAVADFNGDGVPDMVIADTTNNATVVLTQASHTASATLTALTSLTTGTHILDASYGGDANYASSVSTPVTLTGNIASTKLALMPNTMLSFQGQQVVLAATLSPYSGSGVVSNGETITYTMDGKPLGTAKLNSGSAMLNTTSLTPGLHTLSASYAGDGNFAASSAITSILVLGGW